MTGKVVAVVVVVTVLLWLAFVTRPAGPGQGPPASSPVPGNTFCNDALIRRQQAQDALSRPGGGDVGSAALARLKAQGFLDEAQRDVDRYCR